MSFSLTRTVLIEDCLNIMFASEKICETFKEVCRDHFHFAQFGCFRRPEDRFAIQLLEKYRNDWESHKTVKEEIGFRSAPLVPKTQAESVLAFILGWICNRDADHLLKPGSSESSLYQDAFLFHKLYVNNNSTPSDSAAIGSKEVSELFRVLQQRFFIEMHTFIPDVENIEGWIDKLYVNMQEWTAYMDRFAEALMNPDPVKVKQHVTDTNFYHDEDAIVQVAQSLRKGEKASKEEIEVASAAEPTSQYARALKQGFGNLLIASAFFSGSGEPL